MKKRGQLSVVSFSLFVSDIKQEVAHVAKEVSLSC